MIFEKSYEEWQLYHFDKNQKFTFSFLKIYSKDSFQPSGAKFLL